VPGGRLPARGPRLGTLSAVVVAGLGAAAALAYTAPGRPWNDRPVDGLSASRAAAEAAVGRTGTKAGVGRTGTEAGAERAGTEAGAGGDMRQTGTGAGRTGTEAGAGRTGTAGGTENGIEGEMEQAMSAPTYSGFIRSSTHTVTLDVTPAAPGPNTVAITVHDANGAPARIRSWSATASLPGSDLHDVPVALKPFGAGSAWASPHLAAPGRWTFTITVREQDGPAQASFRQVVPIT
jgi:FixH